jgi:hypothetical protein
MQGVSKYLPKYFETLLCHAFMTDSSPQTGEDLLKSLSFRCGTIKQMTSTSIEALHADSLWVIRRPFRFKGIEMGARMTIVRLRDGSLLLISPLDLSPQLRVEIEALGTVRVLLAPNRFHYLCLDEYSKAFSDAQIFVERSVKADGLRVNGTLGDQADELWSDVLDQAIFQGNNLEQEVVFFHRDSRTLIVTDLCFNLRHDHNPLQRIAKSLLDIITGLDRRVCLAF